MEVGTHTLYRHLPHQAVYQQESSFLRRKIWARYLAPELRQLAGNRFLILQLELDRVFSRLDADTTRTIYQDRVEVQRMRLLLLVKKRADHCATSAPRPAEMVITARIQAHTPQRSPSASWR